MEVKNLLPIGSVVLLNNGTKRLMVFGIKQSDENHTSEYDYVGVPYPEGNIGAEGQFFFNHGDINETVFRGFEDAERDDFLNRLQDYYDQQKA